MPRLILAIAVALLTILPATAQMGSLKGHVIDENGAGILDAQVRVLHTQLGAVTNMDGDFVLDYLPLGLDTIVVSALGYHPEFKVLQIFADITIVDTLELDIEAFFDEPDVYIAPSTSTRPGYVTVRGRVRDATTGAMLAQAEVCLDREGMDTTGRGWNIVGCWWRSQEKKPGVYIVHDVPPGYYTADARAPGYPWTIQKVTFRSDSSCLDFNLVKEQPGDSLTRSARVVGRIWDSVKHAPFPNASVILLATGDSARTDPDGAFAMTALPGRQTFTITAPGYHSRIEQCDIVGGRDNRLQNVVLHRERTRK